MIELSLEEISTVFVLQNFLLGTQLDTFLKFSDFLITQLGYLLHFILLGTILLIELLQHFIKFLWSLVSYSSLKRI